MELIVTRFGKPVEMLKNINHVGSREVQGHEGVAEGLELVDVTY